MSTLTISTLTVEGVARTRTVEVELTDSDGNPVAGHTDDGVIIAARADVTGSDGLLELDLVPNADIDPANTYYTVVIGRDAAEDFTFLIEKTDEEQTLLEALADDPQPLGATLMAQHLDADDPHGDRAYADGIVSAVAGDLDALDTAVDLRAVIAGDLTGTPAMPRLVSDTVRYVTATGSDDNDGKTWGKAYATVTAALTALGTTGGTIEIGAGTFAPFTIDASSTAKAGLRIIGRGPQLTKILASTSGQHCLSIWSQASTSVQQVHIEGLWLYGSKAGTITGCGLVLGGKTGEEWLQLGGIHVSDCWIENCGSDGVRAFNINSCVFTNVRVRDNAGWGLRFTGNTADGSGSVTRGNTNTFVNVYTNGNTLGGWLFDQCGNTWSIVGGEQNSHTQAGTYAIEVRPGSNFRGLNLLGVHFERNVRAIKLGDGNSTGTVFGVNVVGCFFDLQTNSYDVVLATAQGVTFTGCQFGAGYTGVLASGTGAGTDQYDLIRCKAGAGGNLLEDKDAVVTASARHLSYGGRVHVQNRHSTATDSIAGLLSLDNTVSSEPWVKLIGSAGSCTDWIGSGSPEGVITATVGSTYRRLDGSATATLYVKETGTGNTGWTAMTGTAQTYGNDEILLPLGAKKFANTNFATFAIDTAAAGNVTLSSTNAQNNLVTWAPVWFRGGTYALNFRYQIKNDKGILTIQTSPDNSTWTTIATQDEYTAGAAAKFQAHVTAGITIAAGLLYVRAIVLDKNAGSSGYTCTLEGPGLHLTRTGA